ncbi:PREDICTED: receptor-like protein 12 [Brassica oleracea var. oleracea]|uniref:receptor-like protein 12 n=1 Tax=Brassica oleracea var. oleracea TaxID=109376 RepID=UPI0006A6C1B8|nr:PREDICTED: receptor-like protein 12 [Brassica oleracea var. oleracea]
MIFVMKGKVFLGQHLIWLMLLLGQTHGYKSCIEKERMALLDLKRYVVSVTEEDQTEYVLPTWTNEEKMDCCHWEGLKCNRTSGRVIEIVFGGLYLKENSHLNLSLLHPFEEVQRLDLSNYEDKGLSGLFDYVEGYKSLRRLRNLEVLYLTENKFNNSIFPFLNAATSLTTLFLRGNKMDGHFPAKGVHFLLPLKLLDLSGNNFSGSIRVRDMTPLKQLKALDLRGNKFSASTDLQGICELKNLLELDFSKNKLVGNFPLCLTSLTRLRVLDLSSNQLTGTIPFALGNLKSLEYLSLFDNNFEGLFSLGSLTNLSELRVLKLSSKSNSFQVVSESSWKPKFQLSVISLRSCILEKVPPFLRYQKELHEIYLSDNRISENFPSWLLANNTNLEILHLKNNSFTSFQLPSSGHSLIFLDVSVNKFNNLFPINIGWILPSLRYINISNNGFHGELPSSLGNMKGIEFLDISHNSFHGKLPRSFLEGCYSLTILKMSHNKLSGEILPKATNFTDMLVLSMDNNQFTGNIGQGLRSLRYMLLLDISNNNLTGVFPSWFGDFPYMNALLVANNMLEGEIPTALFNITYLQLLDLSANMLSGSIPPRLNSTNQVALFLQDNNLSGSIPNTLLVNIRILDLRNNRLSGNIPELINTQNINILLLRGNNLSGRIPRQLCALRSIHLLDLANNRLNGSIPLCLGNTSFGSFCLGKENASYSYDVGMAFTDVFPSSTPDSTSTGNVGTYVKSLLVLDQFSMDYEAATQTKIEFATKHRYDAYMGGNLRYLFGMDLSENELSGEVPVELGGLLELYALNLSHNYLTGAIPKSFSGMKNMESLDLSFNRLQGHIPPQLTELSSLAVFNVSFNNLSGVIPLGKQFNTFDSQSYLGNPLLCGKPTNMSCESNNFHEPDNGVEAEETTIDMVSFYWSLAAAYVTILLGIFTSLSFDSPWSRLWFYNIDAFIHKAGNFLC